MPSFNDKFAAIDAYIDTQINMFDTSCSGGNWLLCIVKFHEFLISILTLLCTYYWPELSIFFLFIYFNAMMYNIQWEINTQLKFTFVKPKQCITVHTWSRTHLQHIVAVAATIFPSHQGSSSNKRTKIANIYLSLVIFLGRVYYCHSVHRLTLRCNRRYHK